MAGRATRGARKVITQETGISGSFKGVEYKESGGGYDGPPPPRGLYPAKLTSVGAHTTGDTAIVWTFDITTGKYAGWRGWVYSDMDNAQWKTQQILVALGVIEPEAEINKTYDQIMKEAGDCRVQIITEDYQDELRPKVKNVLKPSEQSADGDDEDDADDEDFDDKKPAAKTSGRSKKADPDPEDDEPATDDEAREAREEELSDLKLPALKKAAKEAGLALADYRGKSEEELVELILDKEFPEGDGEESGDGIDLDALEEELEDLDLKQLTAKAKEFGATRAELKGLDEEELIDLILEKAEEQNPSF